MPKFPSFPDCFDECKQITITWLRNLGYLRRDAKVTGPFRWTRGGKPSGSIDVIGNLPERYVQLDYRINGGDLISYRVRLESIPKHFGGYEWYLICPATGKRCRTLYGIGKYFLSRAAYPYAMYSSQTESKQTRNFLMALRCLDLESNFRSKRHARTMYRGKLTKRFVRLLDKQARNYRPAAIRQFLDQ